MIEFKKTPDKDSNTDSATVTLNISHGEVSLGDVILEFENFLKAIGYSFNGHLDIVEDETNE